MDDDDDPLVEPTVPVVATEDVEHNEPDGDDTEDAAGRCICFNTPVDKFAMPGNVALALELVPLPQAAKAPLIPFLAPALAAAFIAAVTLPASSSVAAAAACALAAS